MNGILDDLDEAELDDLIASVRRIGSRYASMADHDIIRGLLARQINYMDLARHCFVKKVLVRMLRDGWQVFECIPDKMMDRDVCLAAVGSHGWSLENVPEHLRDREMCLRAVRRDGKALCFVPQGLRDREMCAEAFRDNPHALWSIPKRLITKKMCLDAVAGDGRLLVLVPKRFMDKELMSAVGPPSAGSGSSQPWEILTSYDRENWI